MSRSINTIQDSILTAVDSSTELNALDVLTDNEQSSLSNLTSTSKVAQWRLFVWVVAFGIWVHEQLMDILRADIETRIAATRPFTKQWYTLTALNYQHGYALPETGVYPLPLDATEAQDITASKVIKKAAVIQSIINGIGALRIKVATITSGELVAVSPEQLQGFQEYIELMGAAGVYVVATSSDADDLKLEYKIYFDPLILDNEGKRLDGTNDTPVLNAINTYLKSVEFNGVLSLAKLTDVVQAVEGVKNPFLQLASSKYGAYEYDSVGTTSAGVITDFRQPDSGYLKLDEAESIFTYIAE